MWYATISTRQAAKPYPVWDTVDRNTEIRTIEIFLYIIVNSQ